MATETMSMGVMANSVVRELANIGLAHATTSLAELTGRKFDMAVPEVESVALESLPAHLGTPDELSVVSYMSVDGDVGGHIAFLMPWVSAQALWRMMLGESPENPEEVGELHASVVLEMGNIVIAGLLNAIADMTTLELHATPPRVSMDMTAAVVASIVCEASFVDSVALSIQTEITDNSHVVRGFFIYIPTVGGLRAVFQSLGIQEAA
jgi:chemotaxis protein CheC